MLRNLLRQDIIKQDVSDNAAVKRDSKRLFVIVIALAAVFFAALAAIFLFRPVYEDVGEGVYGNTSGNIANGGLVAENDGWIYYSGSGDLYKVRPDGSGRMILSEVSGKCINIYDGWIYFNNNFSRTLSKIRMDGTGLEDLTDSYPLAENPFICVESGWLYYIGGDKGFNGYIYRIRMDGTEKTQLTSSTPFELCVANGWIYYCNAGSNASLYKIRADGTGETKLSSGDPISINIEGDWVYYIDLDNGNRIYKISTDGTEKIKLSDMPVSAINISGGWIYYGNAIDRKLHKMRTDGTGDVMLSDSFGKLINIAEGWIYYINLDERAFYRMKLDGTENQRVE